jgi:hypothetical protein
MTAPLNFTPLFLMILESLILSSVVELHNLKISPADTNNRKIIGVFELLTFSLPNC